MKKLAMASVLLAGAAMSATIASNARPQNRAKYAYDCELIIEVDRSLATLTDEGVLNYQKTIQNRIAHYVTPHFQVLDSFHVLNNAFSVRINSGYTDLIKEIPGVKSVTKNEAHWVNSVYDADDGLIMLNGEGDEQPGSAEDYGGPVNVSAVTMKKPGAEDPTSTLTNDGAGTVIAVLDDSFHFRAEHKELNAANEEVTIQSWCHESYTRLDDSVVKRFDFKTAGTEVEPARGTAEEQAADKERYLKWVQGTHAATKHSTGSGGDGLEDYDADPNKAEKVINTPLGKEGSLYFNSKIPFYFDYGGNKKVHSDYATHDFDVSSDIGYHGSHVSSTAAANADSYKGIAPNAQLVCMKIGCDYKPTEIEEAVGVSAGNYLYDLPILRALEDCITLGVDGINMSFGNNLNDFDAESITCKTVTKLAEGYTEKVNGVTVKHEPILTAISAGNDGKASYDFVGGYGNWTFDMVETGTSSGYSNLSAGTSIAAGQPVRKFFEKAFKMGDYYVEYDDQVINREGMGEDYETEHKLYEDLITDPEQNTLSWVYVPGFGTEADYSTLTAQDIDVNGKVAVVKRGNISFDQKYQNAKSKGAIALVVINNDPTASSFNMRMDFGGDEPTIPVVMVLYSDMPRFGVECDEGTFDVIADKIGDNIRQYTASSFTSDGATFDLRFKPDVTAPGENIRGAVPPQSKDDREKHGEYATYQFLSGTSMAAPNYAGAQSVLLSQRAKAVYGGASVSDEELQELYAYRKTIDMRLMSTAEPMSDYDYDPEVYYNSGVSETEVRQLTSPRIQGAGMINLGAAIKTDVYLEGLDTAGNGLGKAKIELRNIIEGNINISFLAHNEADQARTYNVNMSLLRPAVEHTTDVLTKEFNNLGDITEIENFPGKPYYTADIVEDPESEQGWKLEIVEHMSSTSFKHMDTYNVPRDIKYWDTAEACALDHQGPESSWSTAHQVTLKAGKYYNAGDEVNPDWQPAPDYAYQSTQDTLIAEFSDFAQVTVAAGEDKLVTLETKSLTNEQKAAIEEYFENGCYLEGFVTLTPTDNTLPTLSIPYMGFYGTEGKDYGDAPVVEPFSFEKDPAKIYPSDLVNDLGKTLVGLSNVDMGSEWITTYLEPGRSFNDGEILENKESLSHLCEIDDAYHLVATDLEGERYENPEQNIYVGSPSTSNTMIIQQFVLRSVADNYFEIKNASGEVVYKDVLQDMLYGDDLHSWPLYKSHVDANFIGGGYLAHRAWAVVSLFDNNGQPFESGNYTIEFNYLLAATGEWVSNSYNMIIDSETPTIENVVEDENNNITININEKNIAGINVGAFAVDLDGQSHQVNPDDEEVETYDIRYAETETGCSITMPKTDAIKIMNLSLNRMNGTGRLFVGLTDKAYGYTGAIVKFNNRDKEAADHYDPAFVRKYRYIPLFDNYTIVERPDFELNYDIEDLGSTIHYYTLDARGEPTEVFIDGYVKVTRFPERKEKKPSSSSGCGGNVMATSITLSALAGGLAISLIIAKTKKKKEDLE